MEQFKIKYLALEADAYLDYLGVENKPAIHFVSMKGIKEYKINEYFSEAYAIYFNIDFFEEMDMNYALLIILHEIYHYSVQGVKGMDEVTQMRDHKLWHLMQSCDVEADMRVAEYMRYRGFLTNFAEYLHIYFQGILVFKDTKMRLPKLERFIGSIVSTGHKLQSSFDVVFLPFIHSDVAIISIVDFNCAGHFGYYQMHTADLQSWQALYVSGSSMDESEFIDSIIDLTNQFISSIPKHLVYGTRGIA
jgi:hypothetical protein